MLPNNVLGCTYRPGGFGSSLLEIALLSPIACLVRFSSHQYSQHSPPSKVNGGGAAGRNPKPSLTSRGRPLISIKPIDGHLAASDQSLVGNELWSKGLTSPASGTAKARPNLDILRHAASGYTGMVSLTTTYPSVSLDRGQIFGSEIP